jgi:hypothetical protein
MPLEEIAKTVGHSVRSTVNKAHELGLKRGFCFFKKSWREEEDEIIRKMYPVSPKEEILKALPNRSWRTVIQRASQLRITRLELARMQDIMKKWQVEKIPEVEKAYLAGIIDGEGVIGISKYHHPHAKREHYVTYFSIINTSKALADWLEEKIFSKISVKRRMVPRVSSLGKKPCYRFTIGTKNACILLKAILPYLVIKKRQAELVIQFADVRLRKPRKAPYSEEEKRLYEECRKLNMSYRLKRYPSRDGSTT